jgi:hypothetical protein
VHAGLKPEEILTRNTLTEPHRTIIEKSQLENSQLSQLTTALRQYTLDEIFENQPQKKYESAPGEW